jgi:signal transduction histidine kinase
MEMKSLPLLENISILVSSSLETEYVCEKILDELLSELKLDAGWIQFLDPENEGLTVVAHRGFTPEMLEEIVSSESKQNLVSNVISSMEAKIVPEVSKLDNEFAAPINAGLHSLMMVPLKMDIKITGIIGLYSSIPERFTGYELSLVSITSAFISFFLNRVYSFIGEAEKRKASVLSDMLDKQEFLNALGHELKTPLTALIASAGMLAEQVDKDSNNIQYRIVQNIINSASSLQDRLSELMDLSASEETQYQINSKEFDIAELVRKVIGYLSPLARTKDQLVNIQIPDSLIIGADEQRIEQILLNLISNSINYTPEGGQIIVSAGEHNNKLLVQVHDTGPGISNKEQLRLFYPYYRVPADRRRRPGLGLGLTITKQLVELHGGTIWVDSAPEKGSTFSFSLPLNSEVRKKN